LYRLTDSLPYLLNRVGVRMGELFSRRIASFDVSLPMYRVMAALWEKGDQRLGDLAFMTSIEMSTLSRLVGTMKRKGLVSRKRLEDNARTVAINLTTKGKALVEELIQSPCISRTSRCASFPSRACRISNPPSRRSMTASARSSRRSQRRRQSAG
jgi:MarR family transcriptional regulator, organic hydroperoxide resistance regulator